MKVYTIEVNAQKGRIEVWDTDRKDCPTKDFLFSTFQGLNKAMDHAVYMAKQNGLLSIRLFDRPENDDMPTILCDYNTFRRLTCSEFAARRATRKGEQLP